MKKINMHSVWAFLALLVFFSCTKENEITEDDVLVEGQFLQFTTLKNKDNNGTVLYSKWLPSQFPNSSANSSEFYNLPLIKNSDFDADTDALLVYGRRNSIFTLPLTLPESQEAYIVEQFKGFFGTTARLRVTSLLLTPLQDIFFRPSARSSFRVVVVPGEKVLSLKSSSSVAIQKMTYDELAAHFGIPD